MKLDNASLAGYLPFCILTGSQRITNLSEDLKHKDIQSGTDLYILHF